MFYFSKAKNKYSVAIKKAAKETSENQLDNHRKINTAAQSYDNKRECSGTKSSESYPTRPPFTKKYFSVFPLLILIYQRSEQEYYYQRKNSIIGR